uniref:Ubiquitin-like-conjugating enzyme ATG10 n=1 Tax=Anopheles dirus TaxID=7168 RepID=A0A182NVF6_9DIPT
MGQEAMHDHEFKTHCDQIVHASKNCSDRWHWVLEGDYSYICMKKKHCVQLEHLEQRNVLNVPDNDTDFPELAVENDPSSIPDTNAERTLSFEYHVLYSESYAVPTLLFNIYDEGGARLNLEDAWCVLNIDEAVPSSERYNAITMVHHPALFRPYLSLHPCKTSELMESLSGSTNPVISFLTSYGPFVNLELDELMKLLQTV